MEGLTADTLAGLWRGALLVIPMAVAAGVVARFVPARPSTRHLLWLTVLIWPAAAAFLPDAPAVPIDQLHPGRLSTWWEEARARLMGEAGNVGAVMAPEYTNPGEGDALAPYRSAEERSARVWLPPTSWTGDARPASGRRAIASQDPGAIAEPAGSEPPIWLARAADPRRPVSPLYQTAPANPSTGSNAQGRIVEGAKGRSDAGMEAVPAEGGGGNLRSKPIADVPVPFAECEPEFTNGRRGATDLHVSADDSGKEEDRLSIIGGFDEATARDDVGRADERAARFTLAWDRWVATVVALRDAVIGLPPIPMSFWLGGALLLGLIGLARVFMFRRIIRSAVEAPGEVRRAVQHAAIAFGVSRAPEVLMTDRRVSPMVWCGLRLRLILPTSLWAQLDDTGRHAVIFHEMAHVRRRDHWVTWAESVIGLVYWWHPLVWWVRGRIHAEAELSCDAWVTTLLPRGRRAYAEALLRAKQFLRTEDRRTPAMAIGVTTGRAGRFARRLTMVMTKSVKPGLSIPGLVLVAAMAATAWLTSPALSCPKEDCGKAKAPKVEKVEAKPRCHGDCTSGKPCGNCARAAVAVAVGKRCGDCKLCDECRKCADCPGCDKCKNRGACKTCVKCASCANGHGFAVAPGATSFERHLAAREALAGAMAAPRVIGATRPVLPRTHVPMAHGVVSPSPAMGGLGLMAIGVGDDDEDEDDEELEARMKRLEERLNRLAEHLERMAGHMGAGPGPRPEPGTPAPPAMHVRTPKPPKAPKEPKAPAAPRPPREPRVRVRDGGNVEWKKYELPEGKLKALVDLMSREDVPVLIRPQKDGIEVQGTRRVHRIFGAFINLIHPSDDGRSDDDEDEGDDDDDDGDDNDDDDMVFDFEFGFDPGQFQFEMPDIDHERLAAEFARANPEHAAKLAEQIRREVEQSVRAMTRERMRAIGEQRREIERRVREVQENAMRMRHRAQELREKGDRIREDADRAREEAEELRVKQESEASEAERNEIEVRVAHLTSQANETEREAQNVDREADGLDREADVVEIEISALEERLEDLNREEEEVHAEQERIAEAVGR